MSTSCAPILRMILLGGMSSGNIAIYVTLRQKKKKEQLFQFRLTNEGQLKFQCSRFTMLAIWLRQNTNNNISNIYEKMNNVGVGVRSIAQHSQRKDPALWKDMDVDNHMKEGLFTPLV